MQKCKVLVLAMLLLATTVHATNMRIRADEAQSYYHNGVEKEINRLRFNFRYNNEVKYKPVSYATGSITLQDTDKNRLTIKFRKLSSENENILKFEQADMTYVEKTEVCKTYKNGKTRCRNIYIRNKYKEDVKLRLNTNSVDIISDSVKIKGIV